MVVAAGWTVGDGGLQFLRVALAALIASCSKPQPVTLDAQHPGASKTQGMEALTPRQPSPKPLQVHDRSIPAPSEAIFDVPLLPFIATADYIDAFRAMPCVPCYPPRVTCSISVEPAFRTLEVSVQLKIKGGAGVLVSFPDHWVSERNSLEILVNWSAPYPFMERQELDYEFQHGRARSLFTPIYGRIPNGSVLKASLAVPIQATPFLTKKPRYTIPVSKYDRTMLVGVVEYIAEPPAVLNLGLLRVQNYIAHGRGTSGDSAHGWLRRHCSCICEASYRGTPSLSGLLEASLLHERHKSGSRPARASRGTR